ncbi:hypothetical protein M0802_015516 [Mischocyttarus mexicanus]|nr:hypothetical protein M0802_015516 [Mischocyttarus mexicanus]
MYLRSHKGAAKGWYEQKRETVGGREGDLTRSRRNNNNNNNNIINNNSNDAVVVVVIGFGGGGGGCGSIKDRKRRDRPSQKDHLCQQGTCCYLDLELAKLILLRSRLLGGRSNTCKRNKVSRLVCLERGMSEGERSVTTPRIGWRKLTDPGD